MKLIKRIAATASAGIAALAATAACASSQPKAPDAVGDTVDKATVSNTEQLNTTEYVDTKITENTDTNTDTETKTNADYIAKSTDAKGLVNTGIDTCTETDTNDTQIETSSPDADALTLYEENTEATKIQTTYNNKKQIPIILTETKDTNITDKTTAPYKENKTKIKNTKEDKVKTKSTKESKVNIEDTTITEDTTVTEKTAAEDTNVTDDTTIGDTTIEDTTKVNGKWYYVDYTWNIDHQYFLTETLWEDHKEDYTDDWYF